MRLSELLRAVPGAGPSPGELDIRGIAVDSRSVRPGDLFVALAGGAADGHAFLGAAAAAGASAALVEREIPAPPLPCVRVPSTVAALPRAAAAFHGDPSARLRVIGVTGTNGKTTTSYLLESILAAAGVRTAVIGTVNYRLDGVPFRQGLTTPFPHELQEVLARAVAAGATHVVMEVSSHSAAQGRIEGVRFDAGVFTNLTHDHLDFHGDMESYFGAKALFFRRYLPAGGKRAGMAFNADDPYGARLAREFPSATTFGSTPAASIHPVSLDLSWDGIAAVLRTPAGEIALRSSLVGAYNASNLMAAVAGALLLGVPPPAIREGVAALRAIPGRVEAVPNRLGLRVLVDYAHTPDGLDRLLSALRGLTPGRLIAVFGCGGNRDRAKRPEMGRVAALRSDVVVVTSDNPRNEDPRAIIDDILPGLRAAGFAESPASGGPERGFFEVITDRKAAIARAIVLARPGDTIAIAGKGHENVQIVGDRRLPFDDREAAGELLAARGTAHS